MEMEDIDIRMGMFMMGNGITIKKMGSALSITTAGDKLIKGILIEAIKMEKGPILGIMGINLLVFLKMELKMVMAPFPRQMVRLSKVNGETIKLLESSLLVIVQG